MPEETPDSPARSTTTNVFTDGACSGNPGPGGWAWATEDGRHGRGGEAMTTNQRMELQAVLEALRAIDGPVVVHSDSTYVVNCFNDRWYEGWLAKGWRNSQRKPVANRDIWEPLIELYLERRRATGDDDVISFVWVKGHAGHEFNELVDAMAVEEATAQKEGLATAAVLPGEGAGPVGPEVPWPIDRAVAVTGLTTLDDDQRDELLGAIDGLDPDNDILISGLRRGAELEGAERGLGNRVQLGVVLPFADPAARWPASDQARFQRCIEAAAWVVTLDGDAARPSKAVAERDRWLWSAVVGVVLIGRPELVDELEAHGLGVLGDPA